MKTKLIPPIILATFLLLACQVPVKRTGMPNEASSPAPWQTYTSAKYHFAIDYPPGWQFLEVPNSDYPTESDQVWFTSDGFPPPQTGARADIVLIFTADDPSPNWQSQYFDDYHLEGILIGGESAVKISGINKESGYKEIVVITKLGDNYIQALPNHSSASLEYFDAVMLSLRTGENQK